MTAKQTCRHILTVNAIFCSVTLTGISVAVCLTHAQDKFAEMMQKMNAYLGKQAQKPSKDDEGEALLVLSTWQNELCFMFL